MFFVRCKGMYFSIEKQSYLPIYPQNLIIFPKHKIILGYLEYNTFSIVVFPERYMLCLRSKPKRGVLSNRPNKS